MEGPPHARATPERGHRGLVTSETPLYTGRTACQAPLPSSLNPPTPPRTRLGLPCSRQPGGHRHPTVPKWVGTLLASPMRIPHAQSPCHHPSRGQGNLPTGVSEAGVPCLPPPLRVGLSAAKCPLSIRRQARDYRGRLFEAETNRKSFSQLPFGDINTAGRGSAGSAVPGGALGCWDTNTRTRSR